MCGNVVRSWITIGIVAAIILNAAPARSQPGDDGTAAEDAPASESATATGEFGPEIYYLLDENGKLQPAWVDKITFEEFVKRIGRLAEPQEAPPSFLIHSLEGKGQVKGRTADVTFKFLIEHLARSENEFVKIPLHLSEGFLPYSDAVKADGPEEFYLQNTDEGFVAFVRGPLGKKHEITIRFRLPVESIGPETLIEMGLPRALKSRIEISVPGKDISAQLSGKGNVEVTPAGNNSQLVVNGATGSVRLMWRQTPTDTLPERKHLEVEGLQVITIEGANVQMTADLMVRSFAGSLERFRVSLPAGARLVPELNDEYSVVVIEPQSGGESDEQRAQIVEVQLAESSNDAVSVRLTAQRFYDLKKSAEAIDFSGFEVADAIRQSGHIAVRVLGDWQIRWQDDFNARFDIRRVNDLPDELLVENLVAGFTYYTQPYTLRAAIKTPTRLVSVTPYYLIDVSPQEATLLAFLDFNVRGAQITNINVGLSGWSIQPVDIGPPNLVGFTNGELDSDDEIIAIPLTQPLKGEFRLVLRARQEIDADTSEVTFRLPSVQESTVATTTLVMVSADDVALGHQVPSSPPPPLLPFTLPSRQKPPFYAVFDRGETAPTDVTCSLQIKQLEVKADVFSHVGVGRNEIRVRQAFEYEIRHKYVDSLVLITPSEFGEVQNLTFWRGEERLTPIPVSGENVDAEVGKEPSTQRLQLPLGSAIGPVKLAVQFKLPMEESFSDDISKKEIPLVMPLDEQFRAHEVAVSAAEGLIAQPTALSRSATLSDPSVNERAIHYESKSPIRSLEMALSLAGGSSPRSTLIRRAWLQSWLSGASRIDFAAVRFESNGEPVEVSLPADADPLRTEIRVDGVGVPPTRKSENVLEIPVADNDGEHLLELRYELTGGQQSSGKLRFEFPQFVDGIRLGAEPIYWQLVLPNDLHLLAPPRDLSFASKWKWQKLGWQRTPFLDDESLVRWVGHSELEKTNVAMPGEFGTDLTNVYLLRMRSLPREVAIRPVSRTVLTVVAAGGVLAIGLLFIYVPIMRARGVLFSACVIMVAVGLAFPEPTLVVAQLAVVGIILAIVGFALRLALNLPRRRSGILRVTGPRSSVRQRVTEVFQPTAVATGQIGSSISGATAVSEPVPKP